MIDEHGVVLMADFQQFYGVNLQDLWTGQLSTRRALILLRGLHDIDDSRYKAELRGGPQFIGWGEDRYIAAELHDWTILLAAAWIGKGASVDDFWKRPKRIEQPKPDEVGTIAEFSVPGFFNWLAGK